MTMWQEQAKEVESDRPITVAELIDWLSYFPGDHEVDIGVESVDVDGRTTYKRPLNHLIGNPLSPAVNLFADLPPETA